VIGANNVAVPTHLYKVVVVENKAGSPVAMGTFIVPNEPIDFSHHLKEYQVRNNLKMFEDIGHGIMVRLLDCN